MTVYITCIVDGNAMRGNGKTGEGFGSLFDIVLSTYVWCRNHSFPFCFSPLVNIGHREHFGKQQAAWDKEWNDYIQKYLLGDSCAVDREKTTLLNVGSFSGTVNRSTGDDVILNVGINGGIRLSLHHPELFTGDIRKSIANQYSIVSKSLPLYFNKDKVNVALHIRTYSSTDCDSNPCRELYSPGNFMETFFINTIHKLHCEYKSKGELDFHIYSQGAETSFSNFKNLGYSIHLHLEEHPITTFHHLIKADVLVMSKSSFSYNAGYYSLGVRYIKGGAPSYLSDIIIL